MFHIVQPCANGPRRFEHATIVSSHRTVSEALNELERVTSILGSHGIETPSSDLVVVTDDRAPVVAGWEINNDITANGPAAGRPAPTAGWEFIERPTGSRAVFRAQRNGALQVWWIDAGGSSSRMDNVEEELRNTPRTVDASAVEQRSMSEPVDGPAPVVTERPRSFWSDCQLRVRWPKAAGLRAAG